MFAIGTTMRSQPQRPLNPCHELKVNLTFVKISEDRPRTTMFAIYLFDIHRDC
jgi:hypothetical protein